MPVFKGPGMAVAVGPFLYPIAIDLVDASEYDGSPGGMIVVHPAPNAS